MPVVIPKITACAVKNPIMEFIFCLMPKKIKTVPGDVSECMKERDHDCSCGNH
jgi:hypothetical protein